MAYLFSYHLGLFVYFFSIGHIAYKVVALGPHEVYLLTCLLQVLLSTAPQDQLIGDRNQRSKVSMNERDEMKAKARLKKLKYIFQ